MALLINTIVILYLHVSAGQHIGTDYDDRALITSSVPLQHHTISEILASTLINNKQAVSNPMKETGKQ